MSINVLLLSCFKLIKIDSDAGGERGRSKRMMLTVVSMVVLAIGATVGVSARKNDSRRTRFDDRDLEMWIDEQQVSMYSGFSIPIYVITSGAVDYRLKNLEHKLPIVPTEVNYVNFSWNAGPRNNYTYNFYSLQSFNTNILHDPIISIDRQGVIPNRNNRFSVSLPCVRNATGVAHFRIGLIINNSWGKSIPGMPFRLNLRKECREARLVTGPDSECNKKCMNNGFCDPEKVCNCPGGYLGQYCERALCYPTCMNNGTCIAPNVCSCPPGFHGKQCEGGLCARKCENGGKCIQKDTCKCASGFYGKYCELTKCPVQCINDGLCIGDDSCQCKKFFTGKHCEKPFCKPECVHGACIKNNRCKCEPGWRGHRCRKKIQGKKKKNDI